MKTFVAQPGAGLAELAAADIEAAFREHGLVVFRGFSAGAAAFDALARRFTRDHFYGYGRAPFAEYRAITTVNESLLALEPHCDNGIRPEPQRPQITWFWCERPAADGGETTFFDGLVVWERLSADARALFAEKQVCFLSRVAEPAWRAMGFTSPEAFLQFLPTVGGTPRGVLADRTVEVEVRSPAVRTPRWSDRPAFVSSLLVAGSRGFEAMSVVLDDGSPVPAWAIDDLRRALASCAQQIAWDAGDVGMLDNTRFLHGRRAFSDARRRVFLIQTLHASF